MSTYTTVRGKQVTLGNIDLQGRDDGSLRITVGRQEMTLAGADASALYDLLGDVMEWESSKNTTESGLNRQSEAADRDMESGKADDMRVAENR